MSAYLVVFCVAVAVTFALTPAVRWFAVRIGAIDKPNDRKVHPTPKPTMGGLAMYGGFLAALLASRFLPFFSDMNKVNSAEVVGAAVACSLIVGLGVVDDKRGITALTKFTGQIFIAGVLILMGVQLAYLWTPFSTQTLVLSENLGVLLTVTWVVVVVNAVNLLDGLDGLAAGMTAIAASAFFVYVIRSGSLFGPASPAALLSVVTVGIAVGFLPWNFFPAKIFMGDTGSMLLGMLLAIATISGVNGNPIKPTGRDLAALAGPLIVTLLILFIPFLDVVLAVARRTWRREAIGAPDKEHLHHRLLDVGHTQRRAVLLMYLWSALISGGALAIGLVRGRFAVGMILLGAVLLILATALPRLTRENGGNGGDGGNGASSANGQSSAEKPSPSEASSP